MHPRYLDRQALIAGWREALLAQTVIGRSTGGYSRHPQLERFREQPSPGAAVATFLSAIADEAEDRGYSFTRSKILPFDEEVAPIPVTTEQLNYEWQHLMAKLAIRSPETHARWANIATADPHPLFVVVDGPIASWERPKN
ncbi:pyrimidine dimer DNA glycosylase /DNA-(apurinic or apyrimidinic site) lyase [Homoserinimonas aerilata]|uniref:Pyrimidine dimer DNA glycosylase /DNA-(Apurinic or apyrimidinic site) lyase n=1 Tax=Homoserinimonas aerilata TaxID=1162970 RepID=A0A542YKK7_9MICO|nr:pyrimidine dimer DNA glycosylase /DNA-(apurinic or apyrimidinic site) lyase [Homoserinimonas aerilata]